MTYLVILINSPYNAKTLLRPNAGKLGNSGNICVYLADGLVLELPIASSA